MQPWVNSVTPSHYINPHVLLRFNVCASRGMDMALPKMGPGQSQKVPCKPDLDTEGH